MKQYAIPWWGSVPLWVAALLVGRELAMTVFRYVAKRQGVVIAAMGPGKLKTIVDKVLPAASIVEAQEYSKSGRAKGKIVLTFQD